MSRLERVESRSMHGQLPVVWDRAEGESVWDPWGNRWIDFTSTIFVANSGHGNQRIVESITRTASKPLLHAYNYPTWERVDFLEKLIAETPSYLEKAFLLSAGTEAVEVAIKLMRLRAREIGKRSGVVVSFAGNWHGRTMGAQQLTANESQREWIGFDDPQFLRIPFPYPESVPEGTDPADFFLSSLSAALGERGQNVTDDVAGFVLETYQGWGAYFYPTSYVQQVVATARDSGALVAFDEMQSGFGRTGRFFGYEHYGVEPDLVCCGKGASSSLPLSFVLGRGSLLDLPEVGSMSSTHSANPLSCAAGLANLEEIIEGGLVAKAARDGIDFQARLHRIASASRLIASVQGRGLVAALITRGHGLRSASEVATDISEECMRRGLLVVHTGRESVKLAPPLTIRKDALVEGLAVLEQVVTDLESGLE